MATEKGTILCVDDDDTVREVLVEHLSQKGFAVVQAHNGEEGVAQTLKWEPDLIVSDIVMPRMDGWDFCHALRLMPSTKTIPFVFLTSLDKTPDRILGLKLGADDYMTKPFSPDEVVFKVTAILKRVRARKAILQQKEAASADTDNRFLLADTVEFLRATQRTGLVAVYGPETRGVVYLRQGKPVHASYGEHTGEAAVFEMFRLGKAEVKYLEKEYPDLPNNIELSWESLMKRVLKRQ